MTRVSSFNYTHVKAQQEVFAQLESAGRRVLVVFSHILFTKHNDNNIRKGAYTQLSHSATDAARRFSHNSTKEVTNSLPVIGRPASANMRSTNNSFFNLYFV